MKKTIGTWRTERLPAQLGPASAGATRARTRSGFGFASPLIGCLLAVAVAAAVVCSVPWSADDGDRIALAALPAGFFGAGFGIVGAVRRSKRRRAGVLGYLVNVGASVGVAFLWLLTHAPA